jgi:threonine/homoserine/homoserine lactone efflux protein
MRKEFGKFETTGKAKTSFFPAMRLGLFTNLTNVKAAVFAVAFIPQFVPKDFNLGWGIFFLSLVQSATSMTWYFSLIAVVDKSSVFLARPRVRRVLTAISAGGILILALGLALSHPR